MGTAYLIDTNTIIYLLDGKLPSNAEKFLSTLIDNSCQLSVISQIELLSWASPSPESYSILETFVADCQIIDLSIGIIQQTIRLRQAYKMKLPDAVIAATALVHGWTLISRNDGDFRKIAELSYINPFTDL
ncbi:type II toxin-antitoxin system VapC family toxin [uncultured Fibrella sp.]|uniref:type II toxin-antitoxin system VapC family toxin n=1 Tax=uncultured Fibrella sp. TaxID=1284596 RepID=UPI0035CB2DFF